MSIFVAIYPRNAPLFHLTLLLHISIKAAPTDVNAGLIWLCRGLIVTKVYHLQFVEPLLA